MKESMNTKHIDDIPNWAVASMSVFVILGTIAIIVVFIIEFLK
jgi:hypothetical protein